MNAKNVKFAFPQSALGAAWPHAGLCGFCANSLFCCVRLYADDKWARKQIAVSHLTMCSIKR